MASLNDFVSSLSKNKSSYGSLFSTPTTYKSLSGLSAPTSNLFAGVSAPKPATTPVQASTPSSTPATSPTVVNKPPVASPTPSSNAKSAFVSSVATPPAVSTPATPVTAPTTPADPKSAYLDSYRDYLSQYASSLKPSEEVMTARTKLADIQNKGEERNLKARREYEATLDTPGMLKAGAEASARQGARRNDANLADIALEESAAARSLSALTGNDEAKTSSIKALMEANKPLQIGDSYIDPSTGKIIYDKPASGIIGEYEYAKKNGYSGSFEQYQDEDANRKKSITNIGGTGGGYGGVPGALSPLAQAVQNGTITIDKIPMAQRAQVAAELATSGIQTSRQTTLTSNLGVVNELLNNKSLGAISGVPALTAFIPGTSAQLAKNQYNQLKGILSLENREKLKGSGAISDFEFKVLSEAATSLGRNLSDADFKKQLEKVRDVFEGKYAQTNAGATNGAPLPNTGGDAEYQAYLKSINGQ